MSKTKLYKIDNNKYDNKSDLLKFLTGILVYAIVLLIADYLFVNIYIDSFISAVVAAILLSLLNYTIKPLLIYWTLPLTIVTYGIAYPIVNIIILKLCDILMKEHFIIGNFISVFFIAIFISILKMFLDNLITKKVGR
ncbi:MAG: phage holin family protein [Bacilli bacterium]|nr:phage holin family protein [Bacilli bacterium]